MERKFKFSLQKVLEIREQEENESIRLLKDSQHNVISTQEELDSLNDMYNKYKVIKKSEDAVYQKIKRNYIASVADAIREKEKQLSNYKRELEIRKKDVIKKRTDKKAVEIIKEKRYKKFIDEENRKEQLLLDELALYSYYKKE